MKSDHPDPRAVPARSPIPWWSAALVAILSVLLCSGAASPATCNQSNTQIGPSGAEVYGAIVGVSAAIAVIVLVSVSHSRHTMSGCVVNGPNGLELQTSESKRYVLEGDPAAIKVGDRVKFHGSRVKRTRDTAGDEVFRVEKLKKDYGPCRLPQGSTATRQP